MDTTAHGEATATGRRRFLRAVGLGGALSAIPVAARSVSARPATRRAAGAAPIVGAPTAADVELLATAQQLELAALSLYTAASEALGGEPVATAQVIDVFRTHHQAYADALSGLLGRAAPNAPLEAVVDDLGAGFSSAETVLEAALELEQAAVATHLALLGELDGTDGSTLIASILTVEARHVATLHALLGEDPMPTEPAATTDASLVEG